jgi:hypothetical protein
MSIKEARTRKGLLGTVLSVLGLAGLAVLSKMCTQRQPNLT